MAVIYLKHPVHGSKVACSEFEAEGDKANGWEVYDPAQATPKPALVSTAKDNPNPEPPASVEAPSWLAAPAPKGKGGRPKKN